jgi:diadenosine tetraphosphate (Ap4A) HIT family hydrolase
MASKPCPFCKLPQDLIVDQDDLALVIRDGFPVSPSHTLVVPKRHMGSFFELGQEEIEAMMALLKKAKAGLDQDFNPDSYNIGVNDGPQAGQAVPHVDMHLIPRYRGDVEHPRDGIRWLIPEKADYWSDRGSR